MYLIEADGNVNSLATEILGRSAVNDFIKRSLAAQSAHFSDYIADQLLPYLLSLLHSIYYTLNDANVKVSLSACEVLKCRANEVVLEQSSKQMMERFQQIEKLPRRLIADFVECTLDLSNMIVLA